MRTHLGQLERLCIVDSYNCQVPYLLRAVLPDGLPKLKSLEIHQTPGSGRFISFTEGANWYETEDGNFLQELTPKAAQRNVDSSYMHSIVQGAPNLEELCLQVHCRISPPKMDLLVSCLQLVQSYVLSIELKSTNRRKYPQPSDTSGPWNAFIFQLLGIRV